MKLKKLTATLIAAIALFAFVLVSTTPAIAASKKSKAEETVKKDTKKVVKKKTDKATKALPTGKININKASKEDLMTLPGIGEVKAGEIIKIRKKGKFKTLDDVMNVSGIGKETLKKLKPFLKFK